VVEVLNLIGLIDDAGSIAMLWGLYIISALVGCWCWKQLFFWIKPGTLVRDSFNTLGAVLLLPPAPVNDVGNQLAPAFLVSMMTAMSGQQDHLNTALLWWLAGLLIGVLFVLGRLIVRLSRPVLPDVAEEREYRQQATRI
jgi:hypothetical protein